MAKRIEQRADTQVRPYLSFQGDGDRTITGVGLFQGVGVRLGGPVPGTRRAVPVPDSIARQFETDEQKALGWVVEWREENQTSNVGAYRNTPVPTSDVGHGTLAPNDPIRSGSDIEQPDKE